MKRICVFAGSSSGVRPEYLDAAAALGRVLAAQNIGLVYGGARVGLMGTIADETLASGGEVIGVIPSMLVAKEIAHGELTELRVVSSMHERKATMAELSDAFIALPGGLGNARGTVRGSHLEPAGAASQAGRSAECRGLLRSTARLHRAHLTRRVSSSAISRDACSLDPGRGADRHSPNAQAALG